MSSARLSGCRTWRSRNGSYLTGSSIVPTGGHSPKGVAIGVRADDMDRDSPDGQLLLREVAGQSIQQAPLPRLTRGDRREFLQVAQLTDEAEVLRRETFAQAGFELLEALFKLVIEGRRHRIVSLHVAG